MQIFLSAVTYFNSLIIEIFFICSANSSLFWKYFFLPKWLLLCCEWVVIFDEERRRNSWMLLELYYFKFIFKPLQKDFDAFMTKWDIINSKREKILDCISHQSRVDFITLSSSILEEICVFTFNKFQWDCQAVFHGENKLNFKNENLYTRKEYRSFFRNIFIFLVYQ